MVQYHSSNVLPYCVTAYECLFPKELNTQGPILHIEGEEPGALVGGEFAPLIGQWATRRRRTGDSFIHTGAPP